MWKQLIPFLPYAGSVIAAIAIYFLIKRKGYREAIADAKEVNEEAREAFDTVRQERIRKTAVEEERAKRKRQKLLLETREKLHSQNLAEWRQLFHDIDQEYKEHVSSDGSNDNSGGAAS